MNHLRFVILLLFCFTTGPLWATGGDFHFRHYTNKNGLSHNTVYCSLQDQRGFMWFGTDDGLNRFDGYTFQVYRSHPSQPGALIHNRIVSLFEDSEQRIWVCTEGGVCFYDYRTDQFHPFSLDVKNNLLDTEKRTLEAEKRTLKTPKTTPAAETALSGREKEIPTYFQFVREDDQGNLWFMEYNRIVRYSLSDGRYVSYPAEKFFHPAAVAWTGEGTLLFADTHSLYVYQPTGDDPQTNDHQPADYNRPAPCDSSKADGRLVGRAPLSTGRQPTDRPLLPGSHHPLNTLPLTGGHPLPDLSPFRRIPLLTPDEIRAGHSITAVCPVPGIGVLVGTDHAGLKLCPYTDRQSGGSHEADDTEGRGNHSITLIPDIQVRDIAAYTDYQYWIASESGLYIYDFQQKTVRHLEKSLTNEYGLSDNAIYSLTKDREGGMWVCAFFGGISYLPRQYSRFHYFIGGKTHPDMLGNAVREIVPDDYGHIWLGTEDNGINCYEPSTGRMVNFSLNNPARLLSATNIHGLMADSNRLWIGTFNKGIDVLDIPSGRQVRQYNRQNTEGALNSNFVLCFYRTRRKEFLIGTSEGMVSFHSDDETFHPWPHFRALVRQIYEDREGNLWLATTQGIYRRPADQDTLQHFIASYSRSHSPTLGSNNTNSIFEDSRGQIWVTTANGLSVYDRSSRSFRRIAVENTFPSNILYRIEEDKNGYFWISTANGLVRFHPPTQQTRTYTYTDGLPETQFNYCSSYQAPDGTLYMGTINGMISFSPETFQDDPYTPPVYITGASGLSFATDTTWLKLPYDASTFTVSYVALSYTAPEAIRYAYQLEGSDTDWVYMKGNQEVAFANLPPGKYVFKVKSTNSSGQWQDNARRLFIWITPPFWATGWAFGLYLVVFFSLIFLFYTYKKKKLEEQHRVRQAIFEARKEKEVYDAKIQFFTFITHEIRTPLTLIRGPLEKILQSGDGTSVTRQHLQLIEKNTERLMELSSQLLDFRKIESQGFRLNFLQTDIPLWLTTVLQPFHPEAEKTGKRFTTDLPPLHFQAAIDREAFTKIIGNLLTNAFKYSDRLVCLQLSAPRPGEDRFIVSVYNDGPLIPIGQRDAIFMPFYRLENNLHRPGSGIGLSLARSLVEFHHGTLAYQPDENGMNRFILTLPLTQSTDKTETISKENRSEAIRCQQATSSEKDLSPKVTSSESLSSKATSQKPFSPQATPPRSFSSKAAPSESFSGETFSAETLSSRAISSDATSTGPLSPVEHQRSDAGTTDTLSASPSLPLPAPAFPEPAGSRLCILVVEDQSDMRRFIAGELADDYQVLEAADGREALKVLAENPVRLIVSDVMMPVMDGFELCNRLKNDVNYSHIPFILLTAQHTLQSRLEGLNQGADAYMEKPFSINLLFAQIRNLLKNREMLTRTYREKPLAPVASLSLSPVDDLFLKKLNDFLDEQIGNEALNVEMLANGMQMSASSLYRKVKGLSGLSPVEFIKLARLKKAVQLMQEGENRINEISYRAGFSSPAYFATCFQRQYGKSPSEFLKDNQYFA